MNTIKKIVNQISQKVCEIKVTVMVNKNIMTTDLSKTKPM